jgi:hypothetical protein
MYKWWDLKLNPIYKARNLINMLCDKLTGRGKINTPQVLHVLLDWNYILLSAKGKFVTMPIRIECWHVILSNAINAN